MVCRCGLPAVVDPDNVSEPWYVCMLSRFDSHRIELTVVDGLVVAFLSVSLFALNLDAMMYCLVALTPRSQASVPPPEHSHRSRDEAL